MPVPPELVAMIRGRLREFLSDTKPDALGLRPVVEKFEALPLTLDMGGCFALRTDGEVISFAWDEPHNLKVEDDVRLRNVALFQGSRRYPELGVLVPPRAPDAATCQYCNGTGEAPLVGGRGTDNLVCYCGGLGWLPQCPTV